MAVFVDYVKEILNMDLPTSQKLYKMIENHFKVLSEDHNLAIVTQLELRQSSKELRFRINEVLKEYLGLLDALLREGMENGEFSPDLDIRLARQMVFGTIDETSTSWVMNDQKYNLQELAPRVHKLLLSGMKG